MRTGNIPQLRVVKIGPQKRIVLNDPTGMIWGEGGGMFSVIKSIILLDAGRLERMKYTIDCLKLKRTEGGLGRFRNSWVRQEALAV